MATPDGSKRGLLASIQGWLVSLASLAVLVAAGLAIYQLKTKQIEVILTGDSEVRKVFRDLSDIILTKDPAVLRKLQDFFMTSGPSSPVRIVGGSIMLHSNNGFSPDSSGIQLMVANADAWTFQVAGVSQQASSKNPGAFNYSVNPKQSWLIQVAVIDGRGVSVKGLAGATLSDGTLTFRLSNSGDSFGTSGSDRQYKDKNNRPCTVGGTSIKCDKIDTITVTIGGNEPEIWHCVAGDRLCNVYIGTEL